MGARVSQRQDTRTALLDAGLDIMLEKGYSNTGLQEVLSSLGVPKGSFYHYFDSKEHFAIEIIRRFDESYSANLQRVLGNAHETPLQRLQSYCQAARDSLAAQECKKGCLIGKLSQEMAEQSEVLREELSLVMRKHRELFAHCMAQGQQLKEITASRSADELAEFFSSGWGGAVMRAKTERSTEPIEIFMDLMFNRVLKA